MRIPPRRADPCSFMQEEKFSLWGDWIEDTGDKAKRGKRERKQNVKAYYCGKE